MNIVQGGLRMTLVTLSWPEAVVAATAIGSIGLILAVATWQIFRTGQTAIKHEPKRREAGDVA
jgi:hypothetical protein